MFSIGSGKDEARIFLEKHHLDKETLKQIEAIASHPAVEQTRIMPDAHKGNGCCVGFTCKLTPNVLPGLIGGDIGCGIAMHPLPASAIAKKKSLARLDRIIQNCIPMGNGHDNIHSTSRFQDAQYDSYFALAQSQAIAFAEKFKDEFNQNIQSLVPVYNHDYLHELCSRTGSNYDYDLRALGTLGGGNHFIEVNQGDNGKAYLTVHTGSRNIGQCIAQYHYKQASGAINQSDNNVNDDIDTTGVQTNSGVLSGAKAAAYFFDMIWAQTFAAMNRRAIVSLILMELGDITYDPNALIESTHNYIDFRDLIVRKGAIRCHQDELCVIALNMRDGVLICSGKGNLTWNYSGPHGCGRIKPRSSAALKKTRKSDISAIMRGFQNEMKDVYSTCVVPETLDERPCAYRDAEIIQDALAPTAHILCHARALLNVKGH
ncbi:hypothetical protein THRCLA_20764 [Thraustotheca clavata]|uniref:3'-phosphate/5'-hydroxy nucleic acid ligase n=1 Tax=Thraustotheca clavata TaxID=74557 RepID=A0A1W0A3T7_9STRA|nr:hypothetical protein THRCLA_20764 [Thraustotheca clavata]